MSYLVRVICITQAASYERQIQVMRQVERLNRISNGFYELGFCDESLVKRLGVNIGSEYQPELWESDIQRIKHLLFANMLRKDMNGGRTYGVEKYGSWIASEDYANQVWPRRSLRSEELDVIVKHYTCLISASQYNGLTLVIEDDSIMDYLALERVERVIGEEARRRDDSDSPAMVYYDFCNYPCFADCNKRSGRMKKMRSGLTRTLCSYMLDDKTAKVLLEDFLPYSLPADFHMQRLLVSNSNISGMILLPGAVENGSSKGLYKSEIQGLCV